MILKDGPATLSAHDRPFGRDIGLVARVLLDYAENRKAERGQLTQRDIAVLTGTDWETVHRSLESLQKAGTIRIERHRIIVNKELLQKAALMN